MLSFTIRLSTFEIPVVEAHITSNVLTVQFLCNTSIVTLKELQIQRRPVQSLSWSQVSIGINNKAPNNDFTANASTSRSSGRIHGR